MNPIKAIVRSALTLGLACCCVWPLAAAPAVESDASIPAVIQAGFDCFQKGQIADFQIADQIGYGLGNKVSWATYSKNQ